MEETTDSAKVSTLWPIISNTCTRSIAGFGSTTVSSLLTKPNSKLGTTVAIIAVFSLLDEVSLLLEETALSELEETVFSELELSGFVVSELELVGLVVSLLEEVSLLLEETVFSELEEVDSELELAGFVVSLLEEVSLLLEETVSSELDDFAELELSGSVCSELELTELELSGSSSELELWLLEDSLSTSTDA